MLNCTGNCPNWLLPVSAGNIRLSPPWQQPSDRGRNSGFFCCQVSHLTLCPKISPVGILPPAGPQVLTPFRPTWIPPGAPFCSPSLQALAAHILLQTACGAGHLQEAHIRGFIAAQSWRIQPDPTPGKLLQDISILGNSPGNALVQTSATRGHRHPHPPAGGTEYQRHLDGW